MQESMKRKETTGRTRCPECVPTSSIELIYFSKGVTFQPARAAALAAFVQRRGWVFVFAALCRSTHRRMGSLNW